MWIAFCLPYRYLWYLFHDPCFIQFVIKLWRTKSMKITCVSLFLLFLYFTSLILFGIPPMVFLILLYPFFKSFLMSSKFEYQLACAYGGKGKWSHHLKDLRPLTLTHRKCKAGKHIDDITSSLWYVICLRYLFLATASPTTNTPKTTTPPKTTTTTNLPTTPAPTVGPDGTVDPCLTARMLCAARCGDGGFLIDPSDCTFCACKDQVQPRV